MAALPAEKRRKALVGSLRPRVAPPVPARSTAKGFNETAASLGIELWPWQQTAARYLTALGQGDRWLYREVAVIVARQNGKTELLIPLIVGRLLEGKRVMHTAQNRELPREIHRRLGTLLLEHYPMEIVPRGIRYGAGQEEIRLLNGGHYRIVAPSTSGARGATNDLVIIDELREMEDHDFIAAAKPTITAAANPQVVYLSNAGSERSAVLNALRQRAASDPKLAYLEWSAAPDRAPDDTAGWMESNPAIGHKPGLLENLEDDYRADLLGGTMANFETEHLCRWVVSMERRYVDPDAWSDQPLIDLARPIRAAMGVSMDPTGERASAVLAWKNPDESVSLWAVAEATGSPVPIHEFGPELRTATSAKGVVQIAYDPWTDIDLARYLARARAMNGREYANASATFVRLVDERKLRMDATTHDLIGRDLARLSRRSTQNGSFMAVRANEQEPATAALAAIRAVALVVTLPATSVARIF